MKNIQIAKRASAVLFNYLANNTLPRQIYLLPGNICPIVPAVFCKLNITFKLIDISLSTYCIDWEACFKIAKQDSKNKYNILYVHSYGFEDPEFNQYLKRWKQQFPESTVIDDRCLVEPSLHKQNQLSDMELYSTGYSKLLEIGHTGWAIFNNKPSEVNWSKYDATKHNNLIKSFNEAFEEKKRVSFDFSSEWLDRERAEVCCNDILKNIEDGLIKSLNHRLKLNEIYMEHLKEWAMPCEYNKWRFNILTPNAKNLMQIIFSEGHFASRHYQSVATMYGQKELPNISFLGNQIVNLFNDYRFDEHRTLALARLIKKQLSTHL